MPPSIVVCDRFWLNLTQMITVEAPELLFPTLYDGAPKAIVIGRVFAAELGPSERLPVQILRASLSEASDLLRLEEPAASGGCGSPRRLSAAGECLVRISGG